MSVSFIYPSFLWLLLLIPLTIGLGLAGKRAWSQARLWLGLGLRSLLLALIVLLGVYPKPFLAMIETSVATTLQRADVAPTGGAKHAAFRRSSQPATACEAAPGSLADGATCGQEAEHASLILDERDAASAGAHR